MAVILLIIIAVGVYFVYLYAFGKKLNKATKEAAEKSKEDRIKSAIKDVYKTNPHRKEKIMIENKQNQDDNTKNPDVKTSEDQSLQPEPQMPEEQVSQSEPQTSEQQVIQSTASAPEEQVSQPEPQTSEQQTIRSASQITNNYKELSPVFKKRALIMGAALIVFIGISLLGYFNIHKWQAATCTEPQICTICGKTKGSPLGHTFTEATCTEPQICKVCGVTGSPATGHVSDENWVIDVQPTCTAVGKRHSICINCGETLTEEMPIIEHTPSEWVVTTQATVDNAGTRQQTCTACGAVLNTENYELTKAEIEALGLYSGPSFNITLNEFLKKLSVDIAPYYSLPTASQGKASSDGRGVFSTNGDYISFLFTTKSNSLDSHLISVMLTIDGGIVDTDTYLPIMRSTIQEVNDGLVTASYADEILKNLTEKAISNVTETATCLKDGKTYSMLAIGDVIVFGIEAA